VNTCRTCRWIDCPTLGSDQQACENWTSDPNGEVPNVADPFAALEARIRGIEERVERVEMMVSRMVTSMITALADVD
jgi:hypothetical protein